MSLARRAPILWLTLRQIRAGRGILLVGLFAASSILFGLIFRFSPASGTADRFLSVLFLETLAPTVIPLATLILATNAFGNEIADRTLPYLVLKPVTRWRLVLGKFTGSVAVTAIAFIVGIIVTAAIVSSEGGDAFGALGPLIAGTLAGVIAYGAIFLLLSLIIQRALLLGIIYILIWESALARFIPGMKMLSVRHFAQSIYVRLLDNPDVTLDRALQLSSATLVVLAISAVALFLATARLRSMNLY